MPAGTAGTYCRYSFYSPNRCDHRQYESSLIMDCCIILPGCSLAPTYTPLIHLVYIYMYRPVRRECAACIRQSHARQAILCPSDWPGQLKLTIKLFISCEGPPDSSRETAGGCRRQPSPAQPSPAQPSPAFASPTPSTSTCARREAKAKARGKSPRTTAKFREDDGS